MTRRSQILSSHRLLIRDLESDILFKLGQSLGNIDHPSSSQYVLNQLMDRDLFGLNHTKLVLNWLEHENYQDRKSVIALKEYALKFPDIPSIASEYPSFSNMKNLCDFCHQNNAEVQFCLVVTPLIVLNVFPILILGAINKTSS